MIRYKTSADWDARNIMIKWIYYILSNHYYFDRLLFEAMNANMVPFLSNMRGPRASVTIDGTEIQDISCLGATMSSAIFFSTYVKKLTICYTYADAVFEGPHAEMIETFVQTLQEYLEIQENS
jgi:hypothetical protein